MANSDESSSIDIRLEESDKEQPAAQGREEAEGSSKRRRISEERAKEEEGLTLKQIYGIFCWLQLTENNKQWQEQPLEACKRAVAECPHLQGADALKVKDRLDEINSCRLKVIEQYGDAGKVPQDMRVIPDGPLFVLADFILSGKAAKEKSASDPQILANATVTRQKSPETALRKPPANLERLKIPTTESSIAGVSGLAARNAFTQLAFDAMKQDKDVRVFAKLPSDHPLKQRARNLTPEEIRQMKDEMEIRRQIAQRDSILLADWLAMKRRELEVKEKRLRRLAASNDRSIEHLLEAQQFIDEMYKEF